MPNESPDVEAIAGANATADRGSPPGIPRWLKVSGIVVVIIVLAAIGISILFGTEHGPGQRGPGQHGPGGMAEDRVLGNAPHVIVAGGRRYADRMQPASIQRALLKGVDGGSMEVARVVSPPRSGDAHDPSDRDD